jgi:hypothetical protein
VSQIIIAALTAQEDIPPYRFLRRFGDATVFAFMEWLNSDRASLPQQPISNFSDWMDALQRHHDTLRDWFFRTPEINPGLLIVPARAFRRVEDIDPSFASRLIGIWAAHGSNWAEAPDSVLLFMMALALGSLQLADPPAIAALFERTHSSLAVRDVAWEEWRVIDDMLPRLSWNRSWDRCERLRRGLLKLPYRGAVIECLSDKTKAEVRRSEAELSNDPDSASRDCC